MPLLTTTPAELGLSDADWGELVETAKETMLLKGISTRPTLYELFDQEDDSQEPEEKYWLSMTSRSTQERNCGLSKVVAKFELGFYLHFYDDGDREWLRKEVK